MRTEKEQKEDIKLAFDTIIYRTEANDSHRAPRSAFYGADEEGVSTLFKKEPFNFDRSLVLTGSSDKIGSVISYGANHVVAFDKNPLAEYLWPLKEAFYISGQSREDFLNYFLFDNEEHTSFSERYYEKIVKYIKPEYERFWSCLYDFYGGFAIGRYLNSYGTIHPNVGSMDGIREIRNLLRNSLPFMEEDRYQLLQERLRNHEVEITLHTCSFEQLPEKIKGETFTFGHLSTLPYFLETHFDYEHFLEQNLLPQLEDEGKIVPAHLYSYTMEDYQKARGFYESLAPEEQQIVLKGHIQEAFEIMAPFYFMEDEDLSLEQANFLTSPRGIHNFRITKSLETLQSHPIYVPYTSYDSGVCPYDTALVYTKKK